MRIDSTRSRTANKTPKVFDTPSGSASGPPPAGLASEPQTDSFSNAIQLSHLSSVLNSLEAGSAAAAKKISSLSGLVASGLYQVQSQLVSSRIVGEALSAH
jgi:hypothetical protein